MSHHHSHWTAEQALRLLLEGNARYVAGQMHHPHQDARRREEISAGQQPFAAILCCSDSRVPPEVVFDRGLGDVFVVRTAGNLADAIALGSLEYAVDHLGTPLVMVLGHEKCGAVTAAVQGGEAPAHIAAIVEALRPAIESVPTDCADPVDWATRANVRQLVAQLKANPIMAGRVAAGTLRIVGAIYYLHSGEVTLLEP